MFDIFREVGQTLRSNRLRTFLTGLAVAWGIFMLIVLLGAARGVENAFQDDMGSRDINKIQMWDGWTSMPYRGYAEDREIKLSTSDIPALERLTDYVSEVTVQDGVDTAKIYGPNDFVTGGINAVYPRRLDDLELTMGRSLNDMDVRENRRSMVLPARNAEILFGSDSAALGKTVTCLGLGWKVVGIYDARWRRENYVPYSTLKAITGGNENPYSITAYVDNLTTIEDGEAAEQAIRSTMAARHQFHPQDKSALWMWNSFTQAIAANAAGNILNITVWVIGLLTLLTGIVGVSNIMFVSVRERTHEIGIRRAIGAKPRSILFQILVESISITAISGYIGLFFGMVVLQIINELFGNLEGFKNPTVSFTIAIEVTVAMIICGAIAGLFPALQAIKVKPVEALRDE